MNSQDVKPSSLYHFCCHKDCACTFAIFSTGKIGVPIPSVSSQAQRPICKVSADLSSCSWPNFSSPHDQHNQITCSTIAFVAFWPNPLLLDLQTYFVPKSKAPTLRIWNRISLRQSNSLFLSPICTTSATAHTPYSIRSSQYSYYVRQVNRPRQQSK